MASATDSTGVDQDRGMCEESERSGDGLPAIRATARRRKERVGQIQPVGGRTQREVHFPWLRLSLGKRPAQSEALAGETHDKREEIPCGPRGSQGLAEENPEHTTPDQRRNAEEETARRVELPWCDRQLRAHLGLRMARQAAGVQMAQPSQPAAEFHMGIVQ